MTAALLLLCLFVMPVKVDAVESDAKAGTVSTSAGGLNVRKSPSTGAAVLASIRKGSYVTLVSKSGSWWYVEYGKNLYGYCHSDYIRQIPAKAATVATASGSLNVRGGPSTSHGKLASLYKGETVLELSASGGWSYILYHGTKTGYVSSRYLSAGEQPVALWLPNLKQMDARWAHVQVGISGRTMAEIGCATTAIAMVESHRTGRTIYPDEMMRSLRYTPSGSVYWPAHYATVSGRSDYVSHIISLLQLGKPVLFGAKNAYGKQHWVVITGYLGGGSTAENLTIHDPGTYSRTNLKQFLEVYPIVYKYFYY